jgi:ribosomal protein S18 acetylase RimI-like enzyme
VEAVSIELRRGEAREAESLADLLWRVREQNRATIPPSVHPVDDMRRWMRDVVFPSFDVWVADAGGELIGLMVLGHPDWIEQLYVDVKFADRGLGTRFLQLAKLERPTGLQLWTFQSNVGACRFYERHGFSAVERTAGDNEEGAPDVRYEWKPFARQ